MRQDIFYFLRSDDKLHANKIELNKNYVGIDWLVAAKLHRVTFALTDLPVGINHVLSQLDELRIRWVQPRPYTATTPSSSRLPPGLHIFFTPKYQNAATNLCVTLKAIIAPDLHCDPSKESYFASAGEASLFQHYSPLSTLEQLRSFITLLCSDILACKDANQKLRSAKSVNIDFESGTGLLELEAYFPPGLNKDVHMLPRVDSRVVEQDIQVDIFETQTLPASGSSTFSKYTAQVGTVGNLVQSTLSVDSRHLSLPPSANFTAQTQHSTNLDSTLVLTFSEAALQSPAPSCSLFAYLTLPHISITGQPQLRSTSLLSSDSLKDSPVGEDKDSRWGSSTLVELETEPGNNVTSAHAAVPLSMRRLDFSAGHDSEMVVPYPSVFWACPFDQNSDQGDLSFDKVRLGYDGAFKGNVRFHHLNGQPNGDETTVGRLEMSVTLPVGPSEVSWQVSSATIGAILVGLVSLLVAMVAWKLPGVSTQVKHVKKDK